MRGVKKGKIMFRPLDCSILAIVLLALMIHQPLSATGKSWNRDWNWSQNRAGEPDDHKDWEKQWSQDWDKKWDHDRWKWPKETDKNWQWPGKPKGNQGNHDIGDKWEKIGDLFKDFKWEKLSDKHDGESGHDHKHDRYCGHWPKEPPGGGGGHVPVPEPTTYFLLAAFVAFAMALRKNRKKEKSF